MMNSDKVYSILAINPGSTSTKFAVYHNEKPIVVKTVRHGPEEFSGCEAILDQKDIRMGGIVKMLDGENLHLEDLDAVVARGGLLKPLESGVYDVNLRMIEDLHTEKGMTHASALGGIIADEIGKKYGIPAYIVDPVVVDEMEPYAKISGMPGIERISIFHALNQKTVARTCAKAMNKAYENCRFVVAHMGGGISVGAHRYGRVIDVNDAMYGDGPFTPERSGSIQLTTIVQMCFSGEFTEDEVLAKIYKNGGVKAYLGTNDMVKVEQKIKEGDSYAALIVDALAHQIAKEIGAMSAVLEGRVDGIILTGGLAYSERLVGLIKQRVAQFAPVYVYPGEDELLALADGALRALRGETRVLEYS